MSTDYYKERPEILRLIPESSRRVLDVGCGSGLLGKALKRDRPDIEVRGIEPVAEVAAQARSVLDDVYAGFAGTPLPQSWPAPDCLVFADTLEHMPDPWQVLRSMVSGLGSGATVVLSLPNVAHHSVAWSLLRGRWEYQDWGILDRTHLRFFTRRSVVQLVEAAGLVIEKIERVETYPGPGVFEMFLRALLWPLHRLEARRGAPHTGSSLLDPFTMQYLVRARVA